MVEFGNELFVFVNVCCCVISGCFSGKVVVVIGVGSGIGCCVVLVFVCEGVMVVVCDIDFVSVECIVLLIGLIGV